MADNRFYQDVIQRTSRRSVEATVSMLGITDKGLRRHLIQELSHHKDSSGFLADPVFESMFPWQISDQEMGELTDSLLLPSLVDAMDNAGEHRFGKNWHPFKHQMTSWATLLNPEHKSLVVTSGTGSGKTECFMVPILNDLAMEYEHALKPLVGVRALFIYPLNALINSQRERLRAWTDAYDDGLRFCLYNGNTQENKHKDQGKYSNEILTRKVMRDTPAPILVTNATMLEYMLVRQIDEPIIQQSQGKLRWIVLDEAHSYIGSQAAELSLLLRRITHAFGVEAKNVRFIATSATMGDGEAAAQLQQYLANVAGISPEHVVVVGGMRSVPIIPNFPSNDLRIDDLVAIDSSNPFSIERYEALAANPIAIKLRKVLTDNGIPSTLTSLSEQLFGDAASVSETLAWVDISSNTSLPGANSKSPEQGSIPFLPLRGHLFHQVLSGLWCCSDKNCAEKAETHLSENWPFGRVYCQRRNHCSCGAPVYELLFCNDCNTPHLMAVQSEGCLIQVDRESVDEFSLDYENPEEGEGDPDIDDPLEKVIIAPHSHSPITHPVSIDAENRVVPPGMDTLDLEIIDPNNVACASCEYSGYRSSFFRRSLLGTPFYISNSIPVLLDACQESEKASDRPNRGRRLITFTDSRQGTARISTKIQQDSERDSVRGLIYSSTANNVSSLSADERASKHEKLAKYQVKSQKLRDMGELELATDIDGLAVVISRQLEVDGTTKFMKWDGAVEKFQTTQDISRWIFDYYKELNPQLFPESGGVKVLSEMLLLREFSRRPKRQNSMETLGLVSVQYPALTQITKMPEHWAKLNLNLADWHAYLKMILDFYIRENSIIDIPSEWVDWMGAKIYPKTLVGPNSDEATSSRVMKWPQAHAGRNGRLVRMLCAASNLDIKDPSNKDLINDVLRSAWEVLTKKYSIEDESTNQIEVHQILKNVPGEIQFHLDRKEIAFSVGAKNWICPITNRLLDSVFKGITPYLPANYQSADVFCSEVDMPICQLDASQFNSDLERKLAVREWVNEQESIGNLRDENLWTDISDRVVEGGGFYRAAEHSAQQPASKLEKYEAMFKVGKLNVLNCSTTMEMGVDIGGISVVAMNNVPPHPANYLQRSGRAGRRGETQALSFTICKDNPHERSVFTNPLWPFTTSIAAPYVTLNSERIVQRHINSLLLSYFLKSVLTVTEQAITSLNCQWFFFNDDAESAPVEKMLRWLNSFLIEAMPGKLDQGIQKITKDSVLSFMSKEQLIAKSTSSLIGAREKWLPSYNKIRAELEKLKSSNEKDPYRRKVAYDLKCMGEQYLLGELASKAFLPGYGFPTGIATFDHYSVSDFKRGKYVNKSGRIDNQTRMRERPGRDMSVAIREYAPGSDVVMDGLVYRSAGILLNKFSPNEDYSEPQTMMQEWRCHRCGFIGNESGSTFDQCCSECGAELKLENIKEYIEPAGFAVDFYSSPTTDISSQMFIPAQEPWVTANAVLNPLFEPRLGAYRKNSEGHIFNHTSGENGFGFAVCLRCGKAESMSPSDDYPKDLQPGQRHIKLQGKTGSEASAWCEGPEEIYAIKRSIHLGAIDQTDVFELYLKHPAENSYLRHSKGDPLPWTLAVALRQALADIHGINAIEMGYTVKPSEFPGSTYPAAGIVLFDNCGGGAGFSSSASRHIKEMFSKALEHLQCSDNCDSACQSCLMGYDTRFHLDLLNRHLAIEYIDTILPYFDVAPEAQLLGVNTKYCLESLSSELLADASHGFETLRLFVSGPYADWDISGSNLKESCLAWRKIFEKVELVLPNQEIVQLSDVHREDLYSLANIGISVSTLNSHEEIHIKDGSLLAQVLSEEETISYATNLVDALIPKNGWLEFDDGYLVRTDDFQQAGTSLLDSASLLINTSPADVEIELRSECDGAVQQFGEKLWGSLTKKSRSLESSFDSNNCVLEGLTYSDCYVCTPWSLILVAEIIDALKERLGARWDSPKLYVATSNKTSHSSGKGLYGEWADTETRKSVIAEYFGQMGEQVNVSISPLKELPHGRLLILHWSDTTETTVRFDHGVGCWSIQGKPPSKWLNLNDAPERQVQLMYELLKDINVGFNKSHATQIFVKNRSIS